MARKKKKKKKKKTFYFAGKTVKFPTIHSILYEKNRHNFLLIP